jgi:hypothetical protein
MAGLEARLRRYIVITQIQQETPGWTADLFDEYRGFVQQVPRAAPANFGPGIRPQIGSGTTCRSRLARCYCPECFAGFHAHGIDPFDLVTQRQHKQQLLRDFMKKCHDVAHQINPNYQVDQNNQTSIGLGERIAGIDNVDIEALPTGGWGYLYYPTNVRYARTFGKSVVGMTGRFHRSCRQLWWAQAPQSADERIAAVS